ncbi:ATP-binding protein [Leeuwenhoekiella parthenopeia]|uniref:ATP-binding protein n=1 Tax=Leeuwenhoekiella parthenopeia TaxID=2890320 RepID=A0ABS8GN23_9FLAO|nr:ATP-binding protein [Leeuwenhoekiella parthenopeia]MCC4211384.1 ATP-binding protein [Leeuwenhoekiella parthenopeia]
MNLQTKQTIALECRNYIYENGLSQSDFAAKAGMGKEFITHILKEDSDFTYSAGKNKVVNIADKYFTRIAEFIGLQLSKSYWEVQPTSQLTAAISILKDAKEFGATNLIIGDTGAGKTHAVDLFYRKNPADTFVVTIGSSDNLADIIDKIIDQLKITTGKTKSKKLRDIASKLRNLKENGANPQLIMDEAEYMKIPALCATKELYDYLHKHASIILIGTPQLLKNLDSLRKKDKPGIPQFYRRIKFGIRQLPTVDRSFKLFLNGLSKPVQAFLTQICDNYGELHDVLVPVRREADRTGEEITVPFIKKVLNLSNQY